jgi:hypothetical protein
MKACLTKSPPRLYHLVNGEKVEGIHSRLSGDVDDCEILEIERQRGANVLDLVKPDEAV